MPFTPPPPPTPRPTPHIPRPLSPQHLPVPALLQLSGRPHSLQRSSDGPAASGTFADLWVCADKSRLVRRVRRAARADAPWPPHHCLRRLRLLKAVSWASSRACLLPTLGTRLMALRRVSRVIRGRPASCKAQDGNRGSRVRGRGRGREVVRHSRLCASCWRCLESCTRWWCDDANVCCCQ